MMRDNAIQRSSAPTSFFSQFPSIKQSKHTNLKKTIMFSFYAVAFLLPAVNAWSEFGRYPQDSGAFRRHRVLGLENVKNGMSDHERTNVGNRILEEFEEMLDEESMIDMSLSLSMSMSLPMLDSSDDSGNPSGGKGTKNPSEPLTEQPTKSPISIPTVTSSAIPSDYPSLAPTSLTITTSAPNSSTMLPESNTTTTTPAPTVSFTSSNPPTITAFPTQSPAPSSSAAPTVMLDVASVPPTAVDESDVFGCNSGDISLGDAADANTTVIFLAVGYRAESTSNNTDDFISELEQVLFETAVNAALGCNAFSIGNRIRRHLREHNSRKLLVETRIVDTCAAAIDGAESCTVMESDIVFFLKGKDVDPDEAAYEGYKSIQGNMTNDSYIGVVPTIVKLEYLSPLPLPVPPQLTGAGSNTNPPQAVSSTSRDGKLSLSPVTIGACIATIMGGLISITVWSRNRHARNRRHIQLTEESMETGSRNPVSI